MRRITAKRNGIAKEERRCSIMFMKENNKSEVPPWNWDWIERNPRERRRRRIGVFFVSGLDLGKSCVFFVYATALTRGVVFCFWELTRATRFPANTPTSLAQAVATWIFILIQQIHGASIFNFPPLWKKIRHLNRRIEKLEKNIRYLNRRIERLEL